MNAKIKKLMLRLSGRDKGSSIVLALFVLALVGGFVALALTRTASEATAVFNEASESRTFYAAQGSLEMMTRNFNKIFELKLSPSALDLAKVKNGTINPGLSTAQGGQFTFVQELDQTSASMPDTLPGGPYAGLYALRDNWRLRTTATDTISNSQVELTRNILNNRIPIFQFGVFYEDDLELFRPPLFSFGGRVHSNRHFFISPGDEGVYFDSRVTAAGHIVTQSWRNGDTTDSLKDKTYIKNASGVFKQLLPTYGSVLNGTPNEFGPGKRFADADLPSSKLNSSFASQTSILDGNLKALVDPLKLPLKVGANVDLIEMIKRGKKAADSNGGDVFTGAADNDIMRAERFANKTGIRVSLADSKAKLPGCSTSSTGTGVAISTKCGVRLEGTRDGQAEGAMPAPTPAATPDRARGYQPRPMKLTSTDTTWGYSATRANGERLTSISSQEVWIKIETVETDETTGNIVTKDITEDILSLGITEQALSLGNFSINGYNHTAPNNCVTAGCNLLGDVAQAASQGNDSRAIIKLQRFLIPGPAIPGGNGVLRSYTGTSPANYLYNVVTRYGGADSATKILNGCNTGCNTTSPNNNTGVGLESLGHLYRATVNGVNNVAIVPFPIQMFDSREGLHYDDRNTTAYPVSNYGTLSGTNYPRISRNGVMSLVDVDIANLRRFLRGDFNGLFPDGGAATRQTAFTDKYSRAMTSSDIPQKNGWVLYISDRRGDADFDGEFDMEDVYGSNAGNDGTLQKGEDFNFNGLLDVAYGTESERYSSSANIFPDQAAVIDHRYFRRGIRLINGTTLPGKYDSTVASNTRGFTVSSENGVYVKGNYNTTGVTNVPSTGNTLYNQYSPFDSDLHIPASIVADAVTILSNSKYDPSPSGAALSSYTDGWNDAKSFVSPYDEGGRLAQTTQMRFAMISGDTISSKSDTPNQGGISPRLNGGVHNFKRFLERWTGQRLDYAGSLINLFNSRNNAGAFKCCNTVYDPPTRNWVFDATFLDPTRLPPGAPFFQYIQTTGFERTNH